MKKKLVYGLIALFALSFVFTGCDNGTTTNTEYIGDNVVPGIRITDVAGLKNALALDPYGAAVNPDTYALYSTADTKEALGASPAPIQGEYDPMKLINQTNVIPYGVTLNLGGGSFTVTGGDITIGGELHIYKGAQLIGNSGENGDGRIIIGEHPEFLRADNDPLLVQREIAGDLNSPLKYKNKAKGVLRVLEGGVLDFDKLGEGGSLTAGLANSAISFAPNSDIAERGSGQSADQYPTYKEQLNDVADRFIDDKVVVAVAMANSGEFANRSYGGVSILGNASTETKLILENGRLGGRLELEEGVFYPSVKVIGGKINVNELNDYIALAKAPFATNIFVKFAGTNSSALNDMVIRKDTYVTDVNGRYSGNLVVEGYIHIGNENNDSQVGNVTALNVAKGGYLVLGTANGAPADTQNKQVFTNLKGALTIDGHLDAGTADAFPGVTELTVNGQNTLVVNSKNTFGNLETLTVNGRFFAGTDTDFGPDLSNLTKFTLSSGLFMAPRFNNSALTEANVALNGGILDLSKNTNPPTAIMSIIGDPTKSPGSAVYGVRPDGTKDIGIGANAVVTLPGGNFEPEKKVNIKGTLNVGAGTAAGTILVTKTNQILTVESGGVLNIAGSSSGTIGTASAIVVERNASLNLTAGAADGITGGGTGAVLTIGESDPPGGTQLTISEGATLNISGTGSGLVIGAGATVVIDGKLLVTTTSGGTEELSDNFATRNYGRLVFGPNSIIDETNVIQGAVSSWAISDDTGSSSVTLKGGALWLANQREASSADGKTVLAAYPGYTVPSGYSPGAYMVLSKDGNTSLTRRDLGANYDELEITGNVTLNGMLPGNNAPPRSHGMYTMLGNIKTQSGFNLNRFAMHGYIDIKDASELKIAANTILVLGGGDNGWPGTISVPTGSKLIGGQGSVITSLGGSLDLASAANGMDIYDENGIAGTSGIAGIEYDGTTAFAGTYLVWSTSIGAEQKSGWVVTIKE
ncbi:hypothetical protein AGMMS50212_09870 [Spirochaetia bacterium]|nr:hypothetical protein AGMMS50212_09870 [Spirochaetia bacterium]